MDRANRILTVCHFVVVTILWRDRLCARIFV